MKTWGLELSKRLKKLKVKGSIQTVLKFNGMVRSGQNTDIGKDINIYNSDDYYENDPNEFEKTLLKLINLKKLYFLLLLKIKTLILVEIQVIMIVFGFAYITEFHNTIHGENLKI